MKKNVFAVGMAVMVLTFAIVFGACSSAPTVYDKSIPLEQSTTIRIDEGIHVTTTINEKSVTWITSSLGQRLVIIPAGAYSLHLWKAFEAYGYRTTINADITHDFLPGHTYFVYLQSRGGKVYPAITDEELLNRELVPDTTRPDASPLEGEWEYRKIRLIFAGDEVKIINDGKNLYRGFFHLNGKELYINFFGLYKDGKFIPFSFSGELTYDGTTLKWGKEIYKKIE